MKYAEIVKLLPNVMQSTLTEGTVLDALVSTIEKMHQPTETLLSELEQNFDPRQARESLLPMLSHWLNMDRLFKPKKMGVKLSLWENQTLPTEPGNLRELIASAVNLSQWRGTKRGLLNMLQIATGIPGYEIKENVNVVVDPMTNLVVLNSQTNEALETVQPFHILVTVPLEARKYLELIVRIVEQEKPAYVTSTIIDTNMLLL